MRLRTRFLPRLLALVVPLSMAGPMSAASPLDIIRPTGPFAGVVVEVRNSDDSSVYGVTVELTDSAGRHFFADSNCFGLACFRGLPAGEYTIDVYPRRSVVDVGFHYEDACATLRLNEGITTAPRIYMRRTYDGGRPPLATLPGRSPNCPSFSVVGSGCDECRNLPLTP